MKNLSMKRYPSAHLGMLLRCVGGGWWPGTEFVRRDPCRTVNQSAGQKLLPERSAASYQLRSECGSVLPSADGEVAADVDSPYSD